MVVVTKSNSFISFIEEAIALLKDQNIKPTWIKMSPQVHDWILAEMNKRDGDSLRRKKHSRLFEIKGLTVIIDSECPVRGAYIGGKSDENWEEKIKNVIGRG